MDSNSTTTRILSPTASTPREIVTSWHSLSIGHSVLSIIPYSLAIEYFVLPIRYDNSGRLEVLMAYPHDAEVLQAVQLSVGAVVRPYGVPKAELLPLIKKHYGPAALNKKSNAQQNGANATRLAYSRNHTAMVIIDDIIHEAIRLGASDIHLEPFERELCVRYRIDGVLHEMMSIPQDRVAELCSRVKIMARMDIAEKRRSQDGRIRINEQNNDVDIRVSTLPTDFGEKIVLRILDKNASDYSLESTGMEPALLAMFKKAVQMPNGIVLLTGPTGSGKTTTLYGVLNFLKKPDINISTVEDPIEYNIPGVNQTQINPIIDMTFAKLLRTLLRQDPDIIMVGEMRDQETAEIAIRSSLTGHLVLSTLHTNDAPSAVTRLLDMGIEHYLVASSLTMVVAQRLVRRICTHCACEDDVPAETKTNLGLTPNVKLYKGLGCPACGYTGYKGRTGIFEVLPISEQIRMKINQKAYTSDIRQQALNEGMITLRVNALAKLTAGSTSLEEVQREIAVIS